LTGPEVSFQRVDLLKISESLLVQQLFKKKKKSLESSGREPSDGCNLREYLGMWLWLGFKKI
jgi:hypothetical protein